MEKVVDGQCLVLLGGAQNLMHIRRRVCAQVL
jgi:hypothetical protein